MRLFLPVALVAGCAGSQASTISPAEVTERMQTLGPELRTCLDAFLDPLTGAVDLSWVVEQDGTAAMVRVDGSTVGNASIEGCVAGVVRRNTFPPPRGEPFADVQFTVDVGAFDQAPPLPSTGILGPTQVNGVLVAHQNTLAGCLAMAQAGGREVTGELELHWRVGADGRVEWARIASASVRDVEVERCLVSSMMTIPFPPPAGGAADLSMPLKLL